VSERRIVVGDVVLDYDSYTVTRNDEVQFYYMESLDAAERILERVHGYLLEWQMDGEGGRNLFPAICNNLAAVRLATGSVGCARELCMSGINRCLNAGMLLPLPALYGNLSNALASLHKTGAAQQAYSRMRMLQEMLAERDPAPASVETEFMRDSYLMAYMY
jgi:hypothetical protein